MLIDTDFIHLSEENIFQRCRSSVYGVEVISHNAAIICMRNVEPAKQLFIFDSRAESHEEIGRKIPNDSVERTSPTGGTWSNEIV